MRHCDLWGLKLELKLGMTLKYIIIFFEILGRKKWNRLQVGRARANLHASKPKESWATVPRWAKHCSDRIRTTSIPKTSSTPIPSPIHCLNTHDLIDHKWKWVDYFVQCCHYVLDNDIIVLSHCVWKDWFNANIEVYGLWIQLAHSHFCTVSMTW